MNAVLIPWVLEAGIVTYRSAKDGTSNTNPIAHLPLPSEYVATFIVFGACAALPASLSRVGVTFAWGIVIATLLNLWDPTTGGVKKPSTATNASKKPAQNTTQGA